MLKHIANTTLNFSKFTQTCNLLNPVITQHTQQRFIKKHFLVKFRKLRAQKVVKIKLPNFHEKAAEDLSEEEARSKLKEMGVLPVRPWNELPVFMTCTSGIFEAYVPPEGDGKFSAITKEGVKQKTEFLTKKGKSMMAVRKIKSFDESFTTDSFPEIAHEIYVKAHELLAEKNENIIKYVTEKAYPQMTHNLSNKQIVWKFLKSLEPCRIVHARCTKLHNDDDIYAQITVRFHTQQILAIYDRFGRLMHGSDHVPKDVLEYIVFERHLANEYGNWRIHDKIVPTWMPPKEPFSKTFVRSVQEEPKQEDALEQVVPASTQTTTAESQPTK